MSQKRETSAQPLRKPSIEKEYEQYFAPREDRGTDEAAWFEQPTIYEVVETVTTYGAYEDPI